MAAFGPNVTKDFVFQVKLTYEKFEIFEIIAFTLLNQNRHQYLDYSNSNSFTHSAWLRFGRRVLA